MKEILAQAKLLTATQIETLISDLADIRSTMSPPISENPPRPGEEGQNVSVQDEPTIQARLLRDGRIRLWIRNAGLGWMVFNLSAEQSVTLREYFIANTDHTRMPALFGSGCGNGNTAH